MLRVSPGYSRLVDIEKIKGGKMGEDNQVEAYNIGGVLEKNAEVMQKIAKEKKAKEEAERKKREFLGIDDPDDLTGKNRDQSAG